MLNQDNRSADKLTDEQTTARTQILSSLLRVMSVQTYIFIVYIQRNNTK